MKDNKIVWRIVEVKQALYFILALILVSIAWSFLSAILYRMFGMVFRTGMFAGFVWLVYLVFKSMTNRNTA